MSNSIDPILCPVVWETHRFERDRAYGTLLPQEPNHAARPLLERAAKEGVVEGARRRDMERAALAGLWLWHDFLDESHTISQSLESPEGSYWHAIMHRREGDFWNSKYWLRRVGQHETFVHIATQGTDFIDRNKYAAPFYPLVEHAWDAAGFVDVCEEVHKRPDDPRYRAAVELQKIEWQELFAHCARLAAG